MTIALTPAFVCVVGLLIHYFATGKTQGLGLYTYVVGLFWLVSSLAHLSLSLR